MGERCEWGGTYTFDVTDACGNKYETSATFVMKDTTPPKLDKLPHDLTVEDDGYGNVDQFNAWLDTKAGARMPDASTARTAEDVRLSFITYFTH